MRGSDTGTCGADIESFGELDKINAQSIGAPQEYGDLDANARVLPLVGKGHRYLSLQDLTWHFALFSTVELVRYEHTKCHSDSPITGWEYGDNRRENICHSAGSRAN